MRSSKIGWQVAAPVGADMDYPTIFVSVSRQHACCRVLCLMAFETACNQSECNLQSLEQSKPECLSAFARALRSPANAGVPLELRRPGRDEEGTIQTCIAAVIHNVSPNLGRRWFDDAQPKRRQNFKKPFQSPFKGLAFSFSKVCLLTVVTQLWCYAYMDNHQKSMETRWIPPMKMHLRFSLQQVFTTVCCRQCV